MSILYCFASLSGKARAYKVWAVVIGGISLEDLFFFLLPKASGISAFVDGFPNKGGPIELWSYAGGSRTRA